MGVLSSRVYQMVLLPENESSRSNWFGTRYGHTGRYRRKPPGMAESPSPICSPPPATFLHLRLSPPDSIHKDPLLQTCNRDLISSLPFATNLRSLRDLLSGQAPSPPPFSQPSLLLSALCIKPTFSTSRTRPATKTKVAAPTQKLRRNLLITTVASRASRRRESQAAAGSCSDETLGFDPVQDPGSAPWPASKPVDPAQFVVKA